MAYVVVVSCRAIVVATPERGNWLRTDRGTLPESRELAENRIMQR